MKKSQKYVLLSKINVANNDAIYMIKLIIPALNFLVLLQLNVLLFDPPAFQVFMATCSQLLEPILLLKSLTVEAPSPPDLRAGIMNHLEEVLFFLFNK